ncbi:MAG: hypothetical protein QF464_17255, partial [Myxococcota bacterium]|nr:hypothetical protein [Myxococcota bacterium]
KRVTAARVVQRDRYDNVTTAGPRAPTPIRTNSEADGELLEAVATRIVEIRPDGIQDFRGGYEEYLTHCGDDHLDADAAVRRGRR